MAQKNRYVLIIERLFLNKYKDGADIVEFERDDIVQVAQELGLSLPKNLGDVLYSFRYRVLLPESVTARAPKGMEWVIMPRGVAKYAFIATTFSRIQPNELLSSVKIPDATPGIIRRYALNDEQALLAIVRYNRLVDIFVGMACYPLQTHLRTTVPGMGQVETDELYIGVDRRGAHHVFPLQAKGGGDIIGIVQIEQDLALCRSKFSELLCKPIAAQFIEDDLVALFAFEEEDGKVQLLHERHYRLVPSEEISSEDIRRYRQSLFE